jgi:hypothetical protein
VVKLPVHMIRRFIRSLGLKIAHTIGTPIKDYQSGRSFGRALIIPWRGKIHVIGLKEPLRAMFQPQKRLTYWKQEIVFTEHPPPDFPRERKAGETGISKSQAPNPKTAAP